MESQGFTKQTNKNWHLVDCSEGTQHQLLHTHLWLKVYMRT